MSKYVDGVNEENMDLFLKSLRSGEFEQAIGVLHNAETNGYCCLGVASEVAVRASEGTVRKEVTVVSPEYTMVTYDGQRLLAPKSVIEWLGIPKANVDLDSVQGSYNIRFYKAGFEDTCESDYTTATELNDDLHEDFETIADVFENEFLKEV